MDKKLMLATIILVFLTASLSAYRYHPLPQEFLQEERQQLEPEDQSNELQTILSRLLAANSENRVVNLFGNRHGFRRNRRQLMDIFEGKSVRLCGKNVSNALELVCAMPNNKPNKRDEDGVEQDTWSTSDSTFPFRSKKSSQALFPTPDTTRGKIGIINECCHKSCTYPEIVTYCD